MVSIHPNDRALLRLARCHRADLELPPSAQLERLLAHLRGVPESGVHHLVALIAWNLERRDALRELKVQTQSWLIQTRKRVLLHDMLAQGAIQILGDRLSAADVEAILLKGHALNRLVYPQEAPRFSADIDLLVRPSDLDRVDATLRSLGCTAAPLPRNLADSSNRHAMEHAYVVPIGPDRWNVDLHWSLSPPTVFQWNQDALFRRARRHNQRIGGLLTLHPEDGLLHIISHAFCSYVRPLYSLLDAHEIIATQPLNPRQLVEKATSIGLRRALWLHLAVAQRELSTPLSPLLSEPAAMHPLARWIALGTYLAGAETARAREILPFLRYSLVKAFAYGTIPEKPSGALGYALHRALDRHRTKEND